MKLLSLKIHKADTCGGLLDGLYTALTHHVFVQFAVNVGMRQ